MACEMIGTYINCYRCPNDGCQWVDTWSCACNAGKSRFSLQDLYQFERELAAAHSELETLAQAISSRDKGFCLPLVSLHLKRTTNPWPLTAFTITML